MEKIKAIELLSKSGMKQSEIARVLGVSRQRIGQLIDKAEKLGIEITRRQLKKKKCFQCNKEYSNNNKYCSKECASKNPRKFGGPSSTIEIEVLKCDGCGTKFSRTKRLTYIRNKSSERRGKELKRVFCTQVCYLKNQ